jgi:hypothetical protein
MNERVNGPITKVGVYVKKVKRRRSVRKETRGLPACQSLWEILLDNSNPPL